MKKLLLIPAGLAWALVQGAYADIIVYNESWENTQGNWNNSSSWGLISGADMVFGGYSQTLGVTEGSYSLMLKGPATTGPNYGAQLAGPLVPPPGMALYLANASAVSLDVYVPPGDFGGYLQWDLALSQSGGLGYQSVDGYSYSQHATIGGETTLTWTIPAAEQTILAENPTLPVGLLFQIGGGFTSANDAVYLDNLTITDRTVPATAPEPGQIISGLAMAGIGGVSLMVRRLRQRA